MAQTTYGSHRGNFSPVPAWIVVHGFRWGVNPCCFPQKGGHFLCSFKVFHYQNVSLTHTQTSQSQTTLYTLRSRPENLEIWEKAWRLIDWHKKEWKPGVLWWKWFCILLRSIGLWMCSPWDFCASSWDCPKTRVSLTAKPWDLGGLHAIKRTEDCALYGFCLLTFPTWVTLPRAMLLPAKLSRSQEPHKGVLTKCKPGSHASHSS